MKKLLLIMFVSILGIGLNAQMLNDFDANQNVPFEGWPNWQAIVANPSATGINTSANVAQWQRTGETWAHCAGYPATPLDFSVNNTFKLKAYSPIVCNVLFKLESINGTASPVEVMDTINSANEWVELSYNFSFAQSGVYDKMVIFFDFSSNNDTVYYFDDVELVPGAVVLQQINLPVDFEAPNVDYTLTDFGGNATVLGVDPIDPLNTVAITTKGLGAETWAGTTVGTPSGFSSPIAFSNIDTKMTLKVYSPAAGIPVRLKVEDHTNNQISVETETLTTAANAWEIIEFDFANEAPGTATLDLANTYDMASVFFDFGTTGNDDVFYWDNLEFPQTLLDQIDLPVDFESTTTDYTVIDFGGTATQLLADPENSANTVAMTTKNVGSETWAGVTVGTEAGFASVINFTETDTKLSMRLYSPAVGIPILFKLEEHANSANSVETLMSTTVANAWETIEFDFANENPGTNPLDLTLNYDKAVLFFDFDNSGNGEIYYWDDIQFLGTVLQQIDLPVTFEDSNVDYTFENWGGNETVLGVDPVDANNTVAISTDGVETWSGTTVGNVNGLATPIPFTETETKLHLRVYSPAAGIPVLLKVEDHTDGSISCETLGATTLANEWETLVFDLTNESPGTPALDVSNTYDKIALFFNFGNSNSGDVFYWDDVYFGDVALVPELSKTTISLYPVPANNSITVEGLESAREIKIYNILGEQVYQSVLQGNNKVKIDISGFNTGVYILSVMNKDMQTETLRFTKND